MKNKIIVFILVLTSGLYAQENENLDQNPNAKAAYEKYVKVADSYTVNQGTTAQETYTAIDPMEEKRIRKKIRKDYRAQRSLWRHEERLERAKNTRYVYSSRPSYYSNHYRHGSFWNNTFRSPLYNFGIGYSLGRIRF